MRKTKYHFFWSGPFSQWHPSKFTIDGIEFVNCEQWMMYNKAIVFEDYDTARQILNTTDPSTHKSLGRRVSNFDDDVWMKVAYQIVVEGNRAKFSQNPKLYSALRLTGTDIIVEASPHDKRWGIGLSENDPNIHDPTKWMGANLLGKAIMDVRDELFNTPPIID